MICLLQTDMSQKGPMLCEPSALMKRKYNLQDSVVAIKNGYVPIRLVNFDVKSKQLLPDTRMGKIYPFVVLLLSKLIFSYLCFLPEGTTVWFKSK